MAVPPPGDPWFRRYWGYLDWPRPGCAVFWTILLIIVVVWVFVLLFVPGLAMWLARLLAMA